MKKYIALFLLICFFIKTHGQEQIPESLFSDQYEIDPENKGTLALSIDNLSFFKNNEFDGDIFDGYSLPGFRLQPRAILYPTSSIKLEGGLSLLKFWGTDKYPSYSYSDISEWAADDYQFGFHLLPFFRAQVQLSKQLNVVLGMLYGGGNHQLIEPMYNPDLFLSADSETGFQLLYNSRIAKVDAWVNWQSFTFRNDVHNEAMIFGLSSAIHITDPNSFFSLSVPVQCLGIHKGGEIDSVAGNLSSMANGAAGLRFNLNFNDRLLKRISIQTMGLGYQELRAKQELFSKGWALYSELGVDIWNLKCKLGWWRSGDYINLFGNPLYGNLSLTIDGRTFYKPNLFATELSYEQKFGNGIYLGADAKFLFTPDLTAYEGYSIAKESTSTNLSMGVYIRVNPSIILKKNLF